MTLAGSRRLRGAVSTLVVLAALSGCSNQEPPTQPAASPPPEASTAGCSDVPASAFCGETDVDGHQVRYSLVRPPDSAATRRTILVDFGGPGFTLLSGPVLASYRESLPPAWQAANLVALEEPWVQADIATGCSSALSSFYTAQHEDQTDVGAGLEELAADISTDCKLGNARYGWQAGLYRDALRSIAATEDLEVEGFVGMSFGAARLTYLEQATVSWAVLVSPSPPPGPAGALYAARMDGVVSTMGECPGCGDAAGGSAAVDAIVGELSRRPVADPKRSVAVTGADVGPALFSLATATGDDRTTFWTSSDHQRAADIGRLSDQTWGRYGVDSLSPSYLSYLDEVCAHYSGFDDRTGAKEPAAAAVFLRVFHLPCLGPAAPRPVRWNPSDLAGVDLCVIGSDADTITGLRAARAWADAVRGARLVTTSGESHGTEDPGLCLPS